MARRNHFKLAISIATFQVIMLQNMISSQPTVFPAANFNPEADATRLRNAMEGVGTDEDTIIGVLAHRSIMQRLQIARTFENMFGKNLVEELESELGGDFKDGIIALMTPLPEFYAREIYDLINNEKGFVNLLLEVCTLWSNADIKAFSASWKNVSGRVLEDGLKSLSYGGFEELLVLLCRGEREEDRIAHVGREAATDDARRLFEAGKLQHQNLAVNQNVQDTISANDVSKTNESPFTNIVVFRSYSQLRMIFEEYERIAGVSIEEAIKLDLEGQLRNGYLSVVSRIREPAIYFAERLYEAIDGLGTDDRTLIRIIVARSEVDLGDIKIEYARKYGNCLATDILEDCTGDFEELLITLLG